MRRKDGSQPVTSADGVPPLSLLFASDRDNRTNLFGVELESGEIEQLTDLAPVPLPREVELLRASKNPVREDVYFWHDLTLLALDIASRRTRTLLKIDPRWCVSMTLRVACQAIRATSPAVPELGEPNAATVCPGPFDRAACKRLGEGQTVTLPPIVTP